MKTCLLIPTAGKGKRFLRKKYKTYKPFLKIIKKEMIQYIFDNFPKSMEKIIIVDKNIKKKYTTILKKKNIKILKINPHNKGPAFSIHAAQKKLNLKQGFFVSYSDILWNWDFSKIKRLTNKNIIFTYKGFHPYTIYDNKYAFCRANVNNDLIDIKEKSPYTKDWSNENLSIGCFYFKNGYEMVDAISKMIEKKQTVNNEYFPSLAFNYLNKKNKDTIVEEVKSFFHLGKPEYYEDFKNWSEKFENIKKLKKTKKLRGLLLIPAAGKGKRFISEGYKLHKPLIEISGKPMLIQSILTHPNHQFSKVIISKKNNSYLKLKKKIKKFLPKTDISSLNKLTKGQAITCLEGLKNENNEMAVTIGSCDAGIIFNYNKFSKLFNDTKTDIIVWSIKKHSEAVQKPNQFSWIKEKKNKIDYISVKKPLKNPCLDPIVLGTFTFKKIKYLTSSIEKMMERKSLINNEYYIDTCINDALRLGYKCKIFFIDSYLSWGTPNDLKTFIYWQKYFDLWNKHPYRKKVRVL